VTQERYYLPEEYTRSDKRPLDKCLNDVASSDVYIGLFAWRYGYVPSGQDQSITELEYECARKNNKPCFIFMLKEDAMWNPMLIDDDRRNIKTLRQKLQEDLTVSFFSTVDELKSTVSASLKDIPSSPTADPIDPYESELKAKYLNWVMEQSSFVSLSGIDPETAREKREELNLGSIYTALLTQSTSDDAQQNFKEKSSERLSALDMLNQHKHLVILGDPGSGKSTFVNFVAWCLAGESIQSPYANIERW